MSYTHGPLGPADNIGT